MFVLENVRGLTTINGGKYLRAIMAKLRSIGKEDAGGLLALLVFSDRLVDLILLSQYSDDEPSRCSFSSVFQS